MESLKGKTSVGGGLPPLELANEAKGVFVLLYQRPKKVVLDKLVRVVIEDEGDGH